MRVAWIGLGSMGRPMALSVLRGGHDLRAYARRPEEHADLVSEGSSVGDNPVEAVADAELVCVNLFSEAQIRTVLIDGDVLSAVPAGAIVAIHSTVSPAFVGELAAIRGDVELLDAGFSGGPDEALAGELTLMVGGDPTAFDQAWEVFRTYANHIAYTGPVGSGMTLKVINNLIFAANVAIAGDALRLVTAAGVDPKIAAGVLLRGSAGSTALRIIGKDGAPEVTMTAIARYLEKDVAIARAATVGLDLGTLNGATSGYAV